MAESIRRGPWGFLLIAAGTLTLLAVAAAWYLLPVRYEAFALLRVDGTPPGVLTKGDLTADEFELFKRTQAQLILSYAVLNGTLRDPSISGLPMVQAASGDPALWLKDRLKVDYPGDAEIMRVEMTGPDPEQLAEIVDRVVEVYLREIVYRDKQLRLENQEQLRRAYEKQTTNYQTQLAALSNLQKIHQTSGSEAAQLKKTLARDELGMLLARRAQIAEEIRQTAVEIALAEARDEATKDVRTGESVAARNVAANEPLSLALLLRKKEILVAQWQEAEEQILNQTKVVQSLESFSEQVATKQEEIEALRLIKNQLKAELDRSEVERLAPDRVTLLDKALLAGSQGDAVRRAVFLGAGATCGLGLIVLGLVLRLPRGRKS